MSADAPDPSDAPTPGPEPSAEPDPFRDAIEAALTPTYALGRELGGGGMSRVFLAEERALGRTVVVKVLPPDLAAGINRDRFRREIQLAARLQHPHIVPLLAAGEVEGSLYYTMPYIEGESVRAALARRRHFSVREVVRLLHDVVDALAYAHARGIVHRDVKPGNVLLQGAHALVTDFGVAKALSAARHGHGVAGADPFVTVTGATSTGLAIGTPAYMAPEQLAADPAADHRVDLYAAALLAYELCTGASPFVADSPRATLAAQLTRMPEPLHQLRPDVPPALSDVIMCCLAKDPQERPPTAEALLADLEAAAQEALLSAADRGWVGGDGTPPAGTTPRSGGSTPVTGTAATLAAAAVADPALTAPSNQPVRTGADATAAHQASAGNAPPAERRHAWLVAGIVTGAGLALLAGVAFSRARVSDPVPPPAAAAVEPAPGPPTVAATAPAPVAPAAPAAPSVAPVRPPTLTREDSLAIAAAVERRLAAEARARRESEARPMAPAEVEAMRAEAWKRYGDSVRAAVEQQLGPELQRTLERSLEGIGRAPVPPDVAIPPGTPGLDGRLRIQVAPPVGPAAVAAQTAALMADPTIARLAARVPRPRPGVRRVTVLDLTDGTEHPELRDVVAAVSEGLRRTVAGLEGYDQPDPGATREVVRLGLALPAAAVATHAGAVLGGSLQMRRNSTVQLTLLVYDAERGYPRQVRAIAPLRASDDATTTATALLSAVNDPLTAALDRVKWGEQAP